MSIVTKLLFIVLLFGFHFKVVGQNWIQWGDGATNTVTSLFTDSITNTLYASGEFISSSGNQINGIAKWNGLNWDSVGFGVNTLGEMQLYNGQLCVYSADVVYIWNNFNWDTIGNEFENNITDIAVFQNELYVISDFGFIAKWNGTMWTQLFPVWIGSRPRALTVFRNELYIGGEFETDLGNNVLRWDGVNWKGLSNGINSLDFPEFGEVYMEFALYKNELYLSSRFWKQDGNPDDCIARWDSTEWNHVGGGLNGPVAAFADYNNELYAAGGFSTAGGITVDGIAKWDGTQWCRFSNNTGINTMTVFNDELIVAGSFLSIDGLPLNRIAKWTGGDYIDTCGAIIGVEQLEVGSWELELYPTPATTHLTLQTTTTGKATYTIYDLRGSLLQSGSFMQTTTIDVSTLTQGLYLIHLQTRQGTVSKKFVKQ